MGISQVVVCVALLWSFSEAIPALSTFTRPEGDSSLRLVHLLFRHGNRNPEDGTFWEGNAYSDESYYPEGYGQLTNRGKLTEYNLGKFLRQRYDSFLGDIWNINYVDFRATNYNRTKMSGLLVMAGLWPPRGDNVWNKLLPWQPIPYNAAPSSEDTLLLPSSACSAFATEFVKVYYSEEIQSSLSEYSEAMQVISENTGIDVDDYASAVSYYDTMKVQDDIGYPLDNWTQQVYPQPLQSLAVEIFGSMTQSTTLKQIMAGSLIKKIVEDSQNFANGTLTPSSRKLFVYSAHDINVAATINSLEAFTMTETPPYGSTVIFELHEISNVWGLKLFYIDYSEESPRPLAIPGCSHFCPLDEFYSLVEEILPTTDVCNGE